MKPEEAPEAVEPDVQVAAPVVPITPMVDEAGRPMCRRCIRTGNRSVRRICAVCNPPRRAG
jgi:hypothetical protein